MLQKAIDAANANPGVCALILCGIALIAVFILAFDRRAERNFKARIRQLEESNETKEALIVHKDAEIKRLKVDLFVAKQDSKIALEKKDAEIIHLKAKNAQLEQDKKQLAKWGENK